MHPLHRNARLSSERPRQWPLAVAAASMVVLCVSVVMLRASAPRSLPAAPPRAISPEPVPPAADAEPDEVPPRATAGTCNVSRVPASMVQRLSDEDAAALVTLVNDWLDAPTPFGPRPDIEHRRGIVHVESEEDRGDDPPYPRSAGPEAQRVCGSAAAWLRTHLRERLRRVEGLACQGNVCCYAGMEYMPTGFVVFHRAEGEDGPAWVIEGWVQVHVAALVDEIATANWRHAETALRRLADTRCPGEPPGSD